MTTSKEFNAVGRNFIKQDHKQKSDLKPHHVRSSTAVKSHSADISDATRTVQKERQAVTTGRATAASTKVIGKRKLKDDAEIEESISKKANTNGNSATARVVLPRKSKPRVQRVQLDTASDKISNVDVFSAILPKESSSQAQKVQPDASSNREPKVDVKGKKDVTDKLKSKASKKLNLKEKLATANLHTSKSISSQAKRSTKSASSENPAKANAKRTINQSGEYEESANKRVRSNQTLSTIKNPVQKTHFGPAAHRIGAKHVPSKSATTHIPVDIDQRASLLRTTSETENKTLRAGSKSKTQASNIQQSFEEDLGKSAKQIQNEIKKEAAGARSREALLRAKNPFISKFRGSLESEQAAPAPATTSGGSETDDEMRPLQNTEYHRSNFRGLTGQGHGQCANAVTQCLATLPKVAEIYKNKSDEFVLPDGEFNEDLFGYLRPKMEHETGALFRELATPSKSAIDISLYHQKLERDGGFGEQTRGDQEVDASPYVKDWIERHNKQPKLHNDSSTGNTPLESMLKRKMEVTIECSGCHERTKMYEDFITPLQLSIPADIKDVMLEDCIDECFKKQTLDNHDCIWCEGLVQATKSTCFAELPPNLIFSLNRTDVLGAKNGTPVSVTTGNMDFGRWLDGDQANTPLLYEFSSMVEHRGKSVSDGMYIATCRMHGSGKEKTEKMSTPHEDTWRVLKDERVSRRFTSERTREEHQDGQLFFLQKVE